MDSNFKSHQTHNVKSYHIYNNKTLMRERERERERKGTPCALLQFRFEPTPQIWVYHSLYRFHAVHEYYFETKVTHADI